MKREDVLGVVVKETRGMNRAFLLDKASAGRRLTSLSTRNGKAWALHASVCIEFDVSMEKSWVGAMVPVDDGGISATVEGAAPGVVVCVVWVWSGSSGAVGTQAAASDRALALLSALIRLNLSEFVL